MVGIIGLYGVVMGFTSGHGGPSDLSFLGIVFGFPAFIVGAIFLGGIKPAFLLMKRNLYADESDLTVKEAMLLVFLILIPTSIVVFSMNQGQKQATNYKNLMRDFDFYQPTDEMIDSMKKRIRNKFKKHDTIFLSVRYWPQNKNNSDNNSGNLKDYYLESIGPENIKNFKWKSKGDLFVVELTEEGYENLRRSKYLRSIYFYDMQMYGKFDGFR